MKKPLNKFLTLLLVPGLAGCAKRNYFPDENNPRLNRFTSHGFNMGKFYLNDVPYINLFLGSNKSNPKPILWEIVTSNISDALMLSLQIGIKVP